MISRRAESSGSDVVSVLRMSNLAARNRTRHTDTSLVRRFSLDNPGSARSISVPDLYLTLCHILVYMTSNIFWSLGEQLQDPLNQSSQGVYGLTQPQTS